MPEAIQKEELIEPPCSNTTAEPTEAAVVK
jgi:hypothetical protein